MPYSGKATQISRKGQWSTSILFWVTDHRDALATRRYTHRIIFICSRAHREKAQCNTSLCSRDQNTQKVCFLKLILTRQHKTRANYQRKHFSSSKHTMQYYKRWQMKSVLLIYSAFVVDCRVDVFKTLTVNIILKHLKQGWLLAFQNNLYCHNQLALLPLFQFTYRFRVCLRLLTLLVCC